LEKDRITSGEFLPVPRCFPRVFLFSFPVSALISGVSGD